MAGAVDGLTVSATEMAPRAAPAQPASTAVRPARSRHCPGEVFGNGQVMVGESGAAQRRAAVGQMLFVPFVGEAFSAAVRWSRRLDSLGSLRW